MDRPTIQYFGTWKYHNRRLLLHDQRHVGFHRIFRARHKNRKFQFSIVLFAPVPSHHVTFGCRDFVLRVLGAVSGFWTSAGIRVREPPETVSGLLVVGTITHSGLYKPHTSGEYESLGAI